MLTRVGKRAHQWTASSNPWTNVYGVARSVLALSTLLTLLFSEATSLFRPAVGEPDFPVCNVGISRYGFFCLGGDLDLLRWVAIVMLGVVASGWRPRLTGLPHWWISVSLQLNAMLTDGGDQITAILTLLLIPVTLTDPRRWHWQPAPEQPPTGLRVYAQITALTLLTAIRVQVAGVYFHAAIGKFAVTQWANGTALYYWLQGGSHGAAAWLQPLLDPLLTYGFTVAMLTWGVMVIEYLLSAALVMPQRLWRPMLFTGILLHGSVLIVQGISSFSIAMMAALVLYLRPWDQAFAVSGRVRRWRQCVTRTRMARPPGSIGRKPSNVNQ